MSGMGSEVDRRMSVIFSHLAVANEQSEACHIFPMNCSNGPISSIPRFDNRVLFARQSSHSRASFMQQVSVTEGASFQKDLLPSLSGTEKSSNLPSEGPMFSRPVQADPKPVSTVECKPPKLEFENESERPPCFAKPACAQKQPFFKKIYTVCFSGSEWSPRMDVAEFGRNYVVMVELPGIGINDIRVEVDDCNLVITGKRSTQKWNAKYVSDELSPKYLRREIMQGPCQVIWPLPNDVNKDGVSAEFIDGILRVTLPKF